MKDQFAIDFNDDTLTVFANPEAEWTMPSAIVARGYGVSPEVIRGHKANHDDELLEGKHWITVQNSNGGAALTWWTKRGVIRLGMFIRSERAKKFRDFCEDLVIAEIAKEPKRAVDPITLALEAALETRRDVIELVSRTKALEQRLDDEPLRSSNAWTTNRCARARLAEFTDSGSNSANSWADTTRHGNRSRTGFNSPVTATFPGVISRMA